MSLSKRATEPSKARPRFNWIEHVGLPIVNSVMVAQPVGLLVSLLTLIVTGSVVDASISIGEIFLLILGLRWWAMGVEFVSSTQRAQKSAIAPLHIMGLVLAFAILLGPHLIPLLLGQDFLYLLFAVILVPLFWRQGIYYARVGFEYGDLASSFKVCLGILLGLLLITMLIPQARGILNALEGAFPLFFLSGIIVLSLARLSHIRKARNADGLQADPSRTWLIALAALCGIIVTFVLVLNVFFSFNSFAFVLIALGFLWNILGMIITWLLYITLPLFNLLFNLLSFVRSLFPHNSAKPPPQLGPSKSPVVKHAPQAFSPELLFIGRWIFLALLLILIVLIVRKSVQKWSRGSEETTLEEERETMDVRAALRERWQEWWNRRKKHSPQASDVLDPTSIRARYRELLLALAMADTTLARHTDETPFEYETRLAQHLREHQPLGQGIASTTLSKDSKEMLHELTDAYTHERYGTAPIEKQQRTRIATWIPRLIAQFTGHSKGPA